jgi:hypothetical protein
VLQQGGTPPARLLVGVYDQQREVVVGLMRVVLGERRIQQVEPVGVLAAGQLQSPVIVVDVRQRGVAGEPYRRRAPVTGHEDGAMVERVLDQDAELAVEHPLPLLGGRDQPRGHVQTPERRSDHGRDLVGVAVAGTDDAHRHRVASR